MYLSHVRWGLIEWSWNAWDIFTEQDPARNWFKIMKRSCKIIVKHPSLSKGTFQEFKRVGGHIKVEALDRRVVDCLGHFHRTRIPGFCMCQNGICTKETESDIAEQVFSKEQHELKTLNALY